MGAARRSARLMQNSAQISGVHKSMVMYAQGNRDWFPGIRSNAHVWTANDSNRPYASNFNGTAPEARFEIMLMADYFEGMYITSPGEPGMTPWQQGTAIDSSQYSYALLRLAQEGGPTLADWERHQEWKDTVNSQAVVMSDRNVAGDREHHGRVGTAQSIWTNQPGDWRGSVCWNDNHVSSETSPLMENTQYGDGTALEDDNLFQGGDGDDTADPVSGRMSKESDADLDHASQ
jgi:hypothetical protein